MKKIVVLFILIISAIASHAGDGENSVYPPEEKRVTLRGKGLSHRPGAPSNFFIDCYYSDGYIGLVMPTGVYSVSVSISNEIEDWSGIVTVDDPVTETPSFSGEYQIECVADNGHTFIGIIEY